MTSQYLTFTDDTENLRQHIEALSKLTIKECVLWKRQRDFICF